MSQVAAPRETRLKLSLDNLDRCIEATFVHCLDDPGTMNEIVDRIPRNLCELPAASLNAPFVLKNGGFDPVRLLRVR